MGDPHKRAGVEASKSVGPDEVRPGRSALVWVVGTLWTTVRQAALSSTIGSGSPSSSCIDG